METRIKMAAPSAESRKSREQRADSRGCAPFSAESSILVFSPGRHSSRRVGIHGRVP